MKHLFSFVLLFFVSLCIHSQATDFITGLNNPRDLLLDDNILYISESNAGRIRKVDVLNPNPVPEIVVSGIPNTGGLALHGTELYFSQLNGENRISKIDLSDPNPTPTVVLENFISAMDLVFYGDELYIAQFGYDRIVKIDPSIPNPPIVEIITGYETPFALEVVGDVLYVAAYGENKVSKIDLTNPNPIAIDVIGNLSLPIGLVHRGYELYIAEAGQSIGNDRISKINMTSSNPIRTTVVGGLYNPTQGLVIYDDVLYIAENYKITSFGLPPLAITDFERVDVSLYPNPTSDFVVITGITGSVNYTLYSLLGAVLAKGTVAANEKINVQYLTNGTYFLVLEDGTVLKILKT